MAFYPAKDGAKRKVEEASATDTRYTPALAWVATPSANRARDSIDILAFDGHTRDGWTRPTCLDYLPTILFVNLYIKRLNLPTLLIGQPQFLGLPDPGLSSTKAKREGFLYIQTTSDSKNAYSTNTALFPLTSSHLALLLLFFLISSSRLLPSLLLLFRLSSPSPSLFPEFLKSRTLRATYVFLGHSTPLLPPTLLGNNRLPVTKRGGITLSWLPL